jgi:hypothetical protein
MGLKWSSVLAFGLATIGFALFFILNFSVWNLSPIVMLWCWQWWVWHSSPLLKMAFNLTVVDQYSHAKNWDPKEYLSNH